MKVSVICFTESGYALMQKIREISKSETLQQTETLPQNKTLPQTEMLLQNETLPQKETLQQNEPLSDMEFLFFYKSSSVTASAHCQCVTASVEQWAKEQFAQKRALLFIGAAGIAVRAIASSVKNKLSDSPVLVMDDLGRFVIPILSGHVGGANAMAESLAATLNATAVITTATDNHHKFAVDIFAKQNQLHIVEKAGIAKVSAKVLSGETIHMAVQSKDVVDCTSYQNFQNHHPQAVTLFFENEGGLPPNQMDVWIGRDGGNDALLHLIPKQYVIGMGCKKGKTAAEISDVVEQCLRRVDITIEEVCMISSIDCKREEQGIVEFAEDTGILFQTFSGEVLSEQIGVFHESSFVLHQVGVGNVCERAAMAACHGEGTLILPKQAQNGITIAIAKRKWSVKFDET